MKEFHFMCCIEIKELLGKRADDEQELLELIEEVPIDSIYYHTHSYFLRHFHIALLLFQLLPILSFCCTKLLRVLFPTMNIYLF